MIHRTEGLQAEQFAITDLTAAVIGVQFAFQGLGSDDLFDQRTVTSSDETLISTSVTGTPGLGTFQFTPVQRAQSHQLLSGGFAAKDEAIGTGEISLKFGGFVSKGVALEHLNGGAGIELGKIRITDRSGTKGTIDLRFAQTIDDVLDAINNADTINVTAIGNDKDSKPVQIFSTTRRGVVVVRKASQNPHVFSPLPPMRAHL